MEATSFAMRRLDYLEFWAVCHRIRLIEEINSSVGSSEWMITVGEAGQAMVLNALRGASRVLYLRPEFCVNRPVDLLIREGLQAGDLNFYGNRAGAVGVSTG